ncbi:hypothetical protein NFI96_016491 [Prochilodus magdalenae]|nr:hypothetical protein NFI96_016491 [Prochilodus magdalenae]
MPKVYNNKRSSVKTQAFGDKQRISRSVMEELRIVLLGKRGAGKSSAGNTLLGSKAFHAAASSQGVTQECTKKKGTVDGQKVCVVDTPGWIDLCLTEAEPMPEIVKCIDVSDPGPHVLLLVLPIGRFTREEIDTVEQILEVFGEEASKYMMVLFTKGDDLEEKTIEEYLEGVHPDLKKIIETCGGSYHVFNNRDKENHEQVSTLLKKIERMVEGNKGKHYTKAMYEKTAEQLKEKRELQKIHLRLSKETCEEYIRDSDVKLNDVANRSTKTEKRKHSGNTEGKNSETESKSYLGRAKNLDSNLGWAKELKPEGESEIEEMRKERDKQKTEFKRVKKELQSEIEEMRKEWDEQKTEFKRVKKELQSEIEELQMERDKQKTEFKRVKKELQSEIEELQKEQDKQKTEFKRVKKELQSEIEEMRKERVEQKTEHENVKKEFKSEIEVLRKEWDEQKTEFKRVKKELKSEIEELRKERDKQKTEHENVKKELQSEEELRKEPDEQKTEHENVKKELQSEEELRKEPDEQKTEHENVNKELQSEEELRKEPDEQKTEHENVKKELQSEEELRKEPDEQKA